MARKSFDIQSINKENENFLKYLNEHLGQEIKLFLNEISNVSEVYVFSGVIRNYFINFKNEIRDLDLVFKTNDIDKLKKILEHYDFKTNSFGGYKIDFGNLNVDFWNIDNTWALNNSIKNLDLHKEYLLPKTSFFNFSSVVFDLKKREFIASKEFINFVQKRELDYVLEDNPLPTLCMINTIYYASKYKLKISKRLKNYYLKNFNNYSKNDFEAIQLKHFNEIKYPYEYLKTYYQIFNKINKKE